MTGRNFISMSRKLMASLRADEDKLAELQSICTPDKRYEEIFACIWDLQEAHEFINPKLITLEKSDGDADTLRADGNRYYRQKKLEKALQKYTLSIMAATHPVVHGTNSNLNPLNGQELNSTLIDPENYGGTTAGSNISLAMGYANRSAVMFEMEFYGKCMQDIELAFEHGYPEELKSKLLSRKEKCLVAPREPDWESQALLSPERSSPGQPDDSASPVKVQQGGLLTPSWKFLEGHTGPPSLKDLCKDNKNHPKVCVSNPKVPALSSAVKVICIPEKGRGLVAARDIQTGEVLASEDAYSISIEREELLRYCSSCLRFCITPLPCPCCRLVLFCSKECRIKGLSEEHWLECSIMPMVIDLELYNKTLAYKMLRNHRFGQIKILLDLANETDYASLQDFGCDNDGIYHSDSYTSINNLCSNLEEQDFELLFMQCQLAFLMTKLLEKSGRFFITRPGEIFAPTRDHLMITGGLMLSHSMKIHYNPYEILNLKLKKPIAVGIYPALSLVNHSCVPVARHYNVGRNLVLRAIRPIKVGEEITDSYTTDFHDKSYESRREYLSNYFINCSCEACKGKWQEYENLRTLVFKCFLCMQGAAVNVDGLCDSCRANPLSTGTIGYAKDLEKYSLKTAKVWQSLYRAVKVGVSVTNNGYVPREDFEFLCKTVGLVHELVAPPCQTICDMQNILLTAFELGR